MCYPVRRWLVLLWLVVVTCSGASADVVAATPADAPAAARWISLFNGRDLEGWTIKIAKQPLGENYADTFRVEDGILKVAYDRHGPFEGRFGHLFTNLAYSHYILRLEYRFEGAMLPDAPDYVHLNSGVMIHAQPPQSMRMDQGFPVSLEMQFLAGDAATPVRPTGNSCSPATHLEMDGKLVTQHIVTSSAPTFPAGEWVRAEIEVRGNAQVVHRINGVEVLRYQRPQLDPDDKDAQRLLAAGAPLQLASGHIALQAEAQGVWFRNIELQPLEPEVRP